MRANIDADSMIYACGFATDSEPVQNCCHLLNVSMRKILDEVQVQDYQVFLTGSGNFRSVVDPTYKANRVNMRKPVHYDAARDFLVDSWGAIVIHGMEADDAVALAQTPQTVLVSQDKDLLMVPGWHYNPRKPEEGVFFVTEEQAQWFFYYQMLAGDRVDNIKGLPYCTSDIVDKYNLTQRALTGCGDKTAKALLDHGSNELEWYSITKECYDSFAKETGEDLMSVNAQLLWMVQELDSQGGPVPWAPPTRNKHE